MAINHLTDTNLQEYLDGNTDKLDTELISHLDSCRVCQARLEQYRQLYNELEIDTVPALSDDFANSVITKISEEEFAEAAEVKKAGRFTIPSLAYSILGAIAALITIIYFVDFKPLLVSLTDIADTEYVDKAVLSDIYDSARGLNLDYSLVVMAAVALLIIGGIDYIVRHYKQRTASFFV